MLTAALAAFSQVAPAQPAALVEGLQIGEISPDSGGFFKAALRVAEGAFRFTTDALYDQLRDNGCAAEIFPAQTGDKPVYHVRIAKLPTKTEAEALAATLRGRFGVAEPKVAA